MTKEAAKRLPCHEWDYWQARAKRDGCLGWADRTAAYQAWLAACGKLEYPGTLEDWLPFQINPEPGTREAAIFSRFDALARRV